MWAERYINGNSILDKNLYNIPIEVEKFWQTQYRDSKYTLFRGISGSRVQLAKWMDNGVFYHKDYKIGDSIILNEKGITSWSKDKNIAKEFMERYGSYGLLFITKAVSKDVFADLSIEYNMDQKEVLLLPGTIKCTILAMTNNTDKNVYKLSDM